ncbi:squalene/phytoene synthase family protein [Thalassobaculum sp.]|uniref:phytoene/squalene synthase family protein n=1 Tax=Thalassobaculum sp. TaxID=2022740 RepID=UPI0032ECDAAF
MTGAAPAAVGFDFACAAIARRHDHERYLACLYAPPSRRAALLALLAANHEVAKTAEVVSEPGIGQIRLQWWRETLEGIATGRPRAHEVAVPLAEAVSGHGLRLDRLHAIVDAREADLDGEPPATLDDLEAYAAATAGELHAAVAEILDADPALARDGGTAWGLLGLMRALPALTAAGRTPLPEALLQENDISHQKIRDMGGSVRLCQVVRPVVHRARRRLAAMRDSAGFRAPAFRPLRLLADRAGDHAQALERAGFEPFALPPAPPAGLVWRYGLRVLGYRLGR